MMVKIFRSNVSKNDLSQLVLSKETMMVKGVIDINQKILALGGELHADAEQVLLDQGSKQADLWGFNIYMNVPKEERLEYTSMINIRPKQKNMSREIQDVNLRNQIKDIIDTMVKD